MHFETILVILGTAAQLPVQAFSAALFVWAE
jgi:hypothetical protein